MTRAEFLVLITGLLNLVMAGAAVLCAIAAVLGFFGIHLGFESTWLPLVLAASLSIGCIALFKVTCWIHEVEEDAFFRRNPEALRSLETHIEKTLGDHDADVERTKMNSPKGSSNPFAAGDPEVLTELLVSMMMPSGDSMTVEQKAEFDRERSEREAIYKEARYGALPANEYRILDQGSFVGWFYELEIGGETVVLSETGIPHSEYQVHADQGRAEELARAEIASRFGDEAAKSATFRVVFGGSL